MKPSSHIATPLPDSQLGKLLYLLSDGQPHDPFELEIRLGVTLNALRSYICRLRSRGHPIVLLTGRAHAYWLPPRTPFYDQPGAREAQR